MVLSKDTEQIIFYFIIVFFLTMIVLILKDSFNFFKHYKENKMSIKLSFEKYSEIKEDPSNYLYYVPYGVSHSLIQFISETPYFINAIDTAMQKNKILIDNYHTETNADEIAVYINIGLQLSNIVANTGKILINRCSFYCLNCSDSFQIICDPKLIQQYCATADSIHDQFERIKNEHIDTPEINDTLNNMYHDFFEYFEKINSLVKLIPNKKGVIYNDKCRSEGNH